MNLVALTPTGCRPEGLALLGEYLNAQTYTGELDWIVVDDCDPESRLPTMREGIHVTQIRPAWRWRPGDNTQARSLLAGLEYVRPDSTLFVLEDDDVYLPKYLETMLAAIEDAELVGERVSRYYNVASRSWRVLRGVHHASMASTVSRGTALQLFEQVVSDGRKTMLDVTLWKRFDGKKRLLDEANVVGIKGLPGRPGIGVGHRRNFGTPDKVGTLRTWIGDYASNYDIFREAA
jgi:hypothetical protein